MRTKWTCGNFPWVTKFRSSIAVAEQTKLTSEKQNEDRHIAVVDDDNDILDLVRAFFQPKGFRVTCFSDAETALAMLQSKGADNKWDVLITDLQLPNMSGFDFIEQTKRVRPDLPIILITVSKSVEVALDAIKKGAYDFLVKPLHFPQLLVSVERAIHLNSLKENIGELREHIKGSDTITNSNIIGRSPNFINALEIAKKVARSTANVFIYGESGTGKEVIARFIHSESPRKNGPLVAINCSAIPENLLESELFGHAKGAFTGAHEKKAGLFEEAEGGTLFLDEIGDLSLQLQAKLLRVLQEKKIQRVGENQLRSIDARVISATHKNLPQEIAAGTFREDLYYRLNVIPIHLPPLRERAEDILPLAESFLKKFSMINGSPARTFSKEAIKFMLDYPWRGNVRELENAVERAVVMATESEVKYANFLMANPELLTAESAVTSAPIYQADDFFIKYTGSLLKLQDVIQKYVEYAVSKNAGAKDKTARELGIDRKTLYKRMRLADAAPF